MLNFSPKIRLDMLLKKNMYLMFKNNIVKDSFNWFHSSNSELSAFANFINLILLAIFYISKLQLESNLRKNLPVNYNFICGSTP